MPTSEPTHRRLARDLEARIHRQEHGWGPGWVLPPVDRLARQLGHGPDTVADAYRLLTHMGLVTTRRGYGAVVRTPRDREVVHLPAGTTVDARMPTFAEQDDWGLEPGVPMLVADGRAWPADRFRLVVGDEAAPSGS